MEQSDLLAEALAASVKVQVEEDLLVKSEAREGAGAAAARLAAAVTSKRCERREGISLVNRKNQSKEWGDSGQQNRNFF